MRSERNTPLFCFFEFCSSKNVYQLLKSLESEATKVLSYFVAKGKTKFLLIRGKNTKKWPECVL
jgi:hypothetical protein